MIYFEVKRRYPYECRYDEPLQITWDDTQSLLVSTERAIRYKIDILAELKKRGYTSTKIREEKLIGQSYLQQLRHGELVSWKTLDTICSLLDCQPADLIEYVKDEE